MATLPGIPCGFHWATGWACPLCGLTRGVQRLVQGDLIGATALHPLTPLVVATAVACALAWASAARRHQPASGAPVIRAVGSILNARVTWVVLVLFAVVRNLPGMSALRP